MSSRTPESFHDHCLKIEPEVKLKANFYSSHEIKRCLLLGKKAMTNLYSILKSRDVTLLTKVHIVKAMVLPFVIYGCESWTIKKAEHRIDAFKLVFEPAPNTAQDTG